MKDILCDKCNRKVGEIEEETHVISDDPFYGIDIVCKDCKSKIDWFPDWKDVNQLLKKNLVD